MKNHLCNMMMAAALMCATQASAQTATDPGEGLRAAVGSSAGTTSISWWGKAGRTYFMQTCETLMEADWRYYPEIVSGTDAVVAWDFSSTAQRGFVRLVYTDQAFVGSAADADFDNDGLSNALEIALNLRTDPFKADSDGDYLNDLLETQLGTNATNDDSDGDGYVDGAEIEGGSDANNANSNPVANGSAESGKSEFPVNLNYQLRAVSNNWSRSRYPGGAIINGSMSWWDDVPSNGSVPPYHTFEGRWAEGLGNTSYPLSNPSRWSITYSTVIAASNLYTNIDPAQYGYDVGRASLSHRAYTMRSFPTGSLQPWIVTRRFLAYERKYTSPQTGSGETTISNVRMESLTIMPNTAQATRILYSEPIMLDREENWEYLGPVTISTPYAPMAFDNWSVRHWIMLPKGEPQVVSFWQNNFGHPPAYQAVGGGVEPSRVVRHSESSIAFTGTEVGDDGYLRMGIAKDEQSTPVFAPAGFVNDIASFTVKPLRDLEITVHPIHYQTASGAVVPAEGIPTENDLESYLNSVFKIQANIECHITMLPAVTLHYDVGLGPVVNQASTGANDGRFQMFQGSWSQAGMRSGEELMVLAQAPEDTNASINLYYISAPSGIFNAGYLTPAAEAGRQVGDWKRNGLDGGLKWTAANGVATTGIDGEFGNVGYIRARATNSLPSTLFVFAHEIGHLLGLQHTVGPTGPVGPGYLANSDNELRLMSGRAGPKHATGPTRLIKAEWDIIHQSPNLPNPN